MLVGLLVLQSDTISGASRIGVCVCVRPSDSVVRVSVPSQSVLGALCFHQHRPLNICRVVQSSLCLYICLCV